MVNEYKSLFLKCQYVFNSPELKTRAFLITFCPASICLQAFYIFDLFLKTTGPISNKLGKHFWMKGIQICKTKGHALFQGEMIRIKWKLLIFLKNILHKTYFGRKAETLWSNFMKGRFKFVQIMIHRVGWWGTVGMG